MGRALIGIWPSAVQGLEGGLVGGVDQNQRSQEAALPASSSRPHHCTFPPKCLPGDPNTQTVERLVQRQGQGRYGVASGPESQELEVSPPGASNGDRNSLLPGDHSGITRSSRDCVQLCLLEHHCPGKWVG